jgi:protein-disulfide isomerase
MKKMTKAIALALLSAGLAPMSAGAQGAPAQMDDPKAVYRVPVDGSPVRGSADALVTIVEVSDFECPFCKRASPTLKQVESTYPGKVRIVFKHNPLSMHRNAFPAALIAEEARVQGGDTRFWAMHDRLYEMPAMDQASLDAVAKELGLSATVAKLLLDGTKLDRIRRDQDLANSLGARGTPTFFVNGRKVVGALPFEAFSAVIDEEIAKAEAMVKAGTPRKDLYAAIIQKGATAPVMVAAPQAAPGPGVSAQAAKVTLRKDDPAKGARAALATVVIFSDFQCPFCSKVEPTIQQIEKAYPGKVRVVWKHQPLAFHPNALPAAKASEAARVQGKFWGMHDRLFANQASLSEATYTAYAKELKLDLARFQKDMISPATAERIAADQKLGDGVGASGTPTLFVNCRKMVGAQPFEAFKPVLDEEIKKGEARIAKGEKLDAGYYDRACAANVAAAPAPPPAPVARTDVKVQVRDDDPSRGKTSAKVTVVEFSDFQCPFCSRAVPAVDELEKKHGKDVRVVWKHMPLSFHPNAMPAALAAEAAREQGKFWEMHDKLFANQASLSDAAYEQFARDLGLDLQRFQAARAAPATRKRVEDDMAAAAAAGVTGTPTFIVNGEPVVGSNGLATAVEKQLKKLPLAGG